MQFDTLNLMNVIQAFYIQIKMRAQLRICCKTLHIGLYTFLHEFGNINPQGITVHFHRAIKLEYFIFYMKIEIGKNFGISVEKLWRFSPDNSIKRSEEHTSELQSRGHLVCRLLLE